MKNMNRLDKERVRKAIEKCLGKCEPQCKVGYCCACNLKKELGL